jgi:hypothetical protein
VADGIYCRHCEEQVESCLEAARDTRQNRIRSYFLTLAAKWTRLARDLESRRTCGAGCPLRETCGHVKRSAAEPKPVLAPAAVSVRAAHPECAPNC